MNPFVRTAVTVTLATLLPFYVAAQTTQAIAQSYDPGVAVSPNLEQRYRDVDEAGLSAEWEDWGF